MFRSDLARRSRGAIAAAAILALFANGALARGPGNGVGSAGHAADGGSGPPRLPGSNPGASCGGVELPDPSGYADANDGVKALSRAVKSYVDQCRCETQTCIADALDRYAEKLAVVAPRLHPALRDLPVIVAQAAHRVRASKTKTEAARILHAAAAQVQHEVELIRAEGSESSRRDTRGGDFVEGTLEFAATKLERADGI